MTMRTSKKRRKMIGSSRSSKHMIQAAEVISNNVDLLTEILVRVPAKSLLRFRCVSKHWLSFISDTHFVYNHARLNHWPPVYGFYFDCRHYKQQKTVSLQGHTTLPTLAFLGGKQKTVYPRPRVIQSCNGLILCKEFRRPIDHYIVCNPTTQKYTVLPKAPVLRKASLVIVRGGFLAFDPSKSPHYRVLVAEYNEGSFNVFSSESSSWKQVNIISPPPLRNRSDYFLGGIFWSGSIHWLSSEIFLRFDFEAEQLIWMPHPLRPKILPVDKIRYFGECCGHLILIQSRLHRDMGFRILEMESDYSGWVVKYQVNLGHLTSAFPQITSIKSDYKFGFLSVVKGKTDEYFTFVLAIAGTIVSYDLEYKTWTVIDFPGQFPFNYSDCFKNSYPFVESLAPI